MVNGLHLHWYKIQLTPDFKFTDHLTLRQVLQLIFGAKTIIFSKRNEGIPKKIKCV